MSAATRCLPRSSDTCPASTRRRAAGGHHIWVTLTRPLDERALYAEAARHGVTFSRGGAVTVERRSQTSFRLSFSLLDPAELDEAVRRLARAIREVRRRARHAVAAPMTSARPSASVSAHGQQNGMCARAPDVRLLEGPGVDRVAVANELEQARLGELLGGPLVQALQPRHDHRVVEHPAEALLVGDVALDVARRADSGRAARGRATGTRPPSRAADRRAGGRAERAARAPAAAPRRARARRGRAASATFMKKRSGALSASARSRCSR